MPPARPTVFAACAMAFVCGCQPQPAPPSPAAPPLTPVTPVPAAATTRPVAPPMRLAAVLKSAPASIDAILSGRKTSTTRKGVRAYSVGPAVTTDGKRRVAIVITAVDPKRFADLTADDAAGDGAASLAAYRAALVRSYPGLADGDTVSVVHFRLDTN